MPHRWKLVYLKVGLIWTICLFSTCAAKDLRCVVNRFCRTGPVPSSDNLKRLSCESKSARDFRRPGLKSTSPFNSVKRIADEPLSAAKTTPLVKHRSRASLNTPFEHLHRLVGVNAVLRDYRESKSQSNASTLPWGPISSAIGQHYFGWISRSDTFQELLCGLPNVSP